MKLFRSAGYLLLVAVTLTFLSSVSKAQSDLPDGKGKQEVVRICNDCHGMKVITQTRASRKGWAKTIDEMQGFGAQGTDEEIGLVVAYLSVHFGKPIYVNKTTGKELEDAFSLSPKEAEAIVKYRQENGNFKELNDLLKVPGGNADKIREQSVNIVYSDPEDQK